MVLGTFHFHEDALYDVLQAENQAALEQLTTKLAAFAPTKICLELTPDRAAVINERYQQYLNNEFDISEKHNEVYQIGFRLARRLQHDSLYLIDNQTEFIGSLEDFSFEKLEEEGQRTAADFYNKYDKQIGKIFQQHRDTSQQLSLLEYLQFLNSETNQAYNTGRMHLREVKVGIGESWMGADWLGRWYQRNVRMFAKVLQLTESAEDRILIIAGDNHKWVLEQLFEYSPEFEVVDVAQFFK